MPASKIVDQREFDLSGRGVTPMPKKLTRGRSTGVLFLLASLAIPQSATGANNQRPRDPNERVCEIVRPTGSRLGGKKICATRAEWDQMKQRDKDATNEAQRSARVGCSVAPSSVHGGAPSC
jgi:hypothetical protein